MTSNPAKILSALFLVSKNPVTITIVSLLVPIMLLYGATKFVAAQKEALVFFAVLGVSCLIYSGLIYFVWSIFSIKSSKKK